MNTKKLFFFAAALGLFTTSCTNTATDATQGIVKADMTQTSANVATAINALSGSAGYEVLATSGQDITGVSAPLYVQAAESSTSYTDSIVLKDIVGTYSLQNAATVKPLVLYSFFKQESKTPTDSLILLFPLAKVNKLKRLFNDTTAVNQKECKVSVSNYYRYSNKTTGESSYSLASTVSKLDPASTIYKKSGTYKVSRSVTTTNGIKNGKSSFEFDFLSGHVAKCAFMSSDTASTATYTLSDGTKTLFEEKFWSTKAQADKKFVEKQYSLTYGNVTLIRKPGVHSLDSIQILLNGVLQTKAKITVTKTTAFVADSTENGITNGRREIIITFDDANATTVNITSLTGASTLNKMREMFAHLRKSYFGTYLIDASAQNINRVNKAGRII